MVGTRGSRMLNLAYTMEIADLEPKLTELWERVASQVGKDAVNFRRSREARCARSIAWLLDPDLKFKRVYVFDNASQEHDYGVRKLARYILKYSTKPIKRGKRELTTSYFIRFKNRHNFLKTYEKRLRELARLN